MIFQSCDDVFPEDQDGMVSAFTGLLGMVMSWILETMVPYFFILIVAVVCLFSIEVTWLLKTATT